jgi:hypothetical protein
VSSVEQAPQHVAGGTTHALPNLLIIGAAKAGTTSLHRYLDLHPEIFMSRVKELKLFIRDDWRDHLGWYREQFPSSLPVRGESSPAYSMDPWWPHVPERVRELVPDARMIYMVRDPVDRLVAQWVEMYADHDEHRPMTEALADYDQPSNKVVMPSRYAYQLDRWREHFPDDRILVLDQRDLLQSRSETLRRAFSFLGVDADFDSEAFERLHNERGGKHRANRLGVWIYHRGWLARAQDSSRFLPDGIRDRLKRAVAEPVSTPPLDPVLRGELEAYLREDADRLRAQTGLRLEHWSV